MFFSIYKLLKLHLIIFHFIFDKLPSFLRPVTSCKVIEMTKDVLEDIFKQCDPRHIFCPIAIRFGDLIPDEPYLVLRKELLLHVMFL